MTRKLDRRSFLGGTAATLAGAAALSGEAAAHQVGSTIYTTTDLNIRYGPSLDYGVKRTAPQNTGMYVKDGPWQNDGYTWWKVNVNGDSNDYSRYDGYCVQQHTGHADFALPATGQVTSTYWDCRDDCNRYHRAMDIANDKGTAIHAARGGTVSYAGWVSGYGYVVYVDHGGGYQTRYGHLNDIYVSDGQSVNTYDHIGAMGNTGNSSGDHVHFEIRRDGSKLNWPMTKYAYVWAKTGAPKNFSGI
jgi:murein DD-endopeptidase MepM/ murein hydrolase activator NlpD